MAYKVLPVLWQRFFDADAESLSGGKLYSYIAGTSTLRATAQDSIGTPNTNPIILDADGYADVWILVGSGNYKFVLTDAADVVLKTIDNFSLVDESGATPTGWSTHTVVGGQSATALTGETLDMALYSSALYDVEILRGTTIMATGPIAIQNLNGTARVLTGMLLTLEDHGVTFDCSQVGLVATLTAALSAGSDGTIKMSRRIIPD